MSKERCYLCQSFQSDGPSYLACWQDEQHNDNIHQKMLKYSLTIFFINRMLILFKVYEGLQIGVFLILAKMP